MTGGLRFHVVLCHGPRPTGVSAEGGRRPIGWPRRPAALPVDLVPRCGAPRSWLPPIGGAQPPLPHDAARFRAAMAVPLPPLPSPSPPPPPPAEVCVVSIARFGTRGRGRVLPRRFFGWPGRPRPPIPPPLSSRAPHVVVVEVVSPLAPRAGSRPQQSDRCLLCAREHPPLAAPLRSTSPPVSHALQLVARVADAVRAAPPSLPPHPCHNAAHGRGPWFNSLAVTAGRERRCSYGHWWGW